MKLTKRQQQTLDYITSHLQQHGYAPSVRDIGKAIGLSSSATVHGHLSNLEKKGLIKKDIRRPRTLQVLV